MNQPPIPTSAPLDPRDLLIHLHQWLIWERERNTQHFGESDQSGHPHGYAGVVIPEWDVRQKLDEIEQSLALPIIRTAPNSHPQDGGPVEIAWEEAK